MSYLVVEGGDGCGKSSQAKALAGWLSAQGRKVLHVREPGSTPVGEALRTLLLSPATGALRRETEALLFSAARGELVHGVIAPALRDGAIVVAERCFVSTIVYQGYAVGGDVDWLFDLSRRVHDGCMPDRVFVLDLPPQQALERRRARVADRFEERGIDYQERVRQGFLRCAEREPSLRIVDASRPFSAVHDELCAMAREIVA